MSVRWYVLMLGAVACGSRPSNEAVEEPADSAFPVEALADTADPLPFTDLKSAEILRLNERWTGDYDSLGQRRFIRVLVPFNRTLYYFDRGVQKGIAFESLREFESTLPAGSNGVHPHTSSNRMQPRE